MNIVTIHKDSRMKIIKAYYLGEFLYTRTYLYDRDGYATKIITVMDDGKTVVQSYI